MSPADEIFQISDFSTDSSNTKKEVNSSAAQQFKIIYVVVANKGEAPLCDLEAAAKKYHFNSWPPERLPVNKSRNRRRRWAIRVANRKKEVGQNACSILG